MSGEPIQVADVASDSRFARDVAEATEYVPTTVLAAPVADVGGDEIAGVLEVLDPAEGAGRDSGRDLAILGLFASQLGAIIRLSALYDAVGTGLLRTLADPDGEGVFDDALADAARTGPDAGLQGVADAFRELSSAGPAAARMAERVLSEVAAYVRQTSSPRPPGSRGRPDRGRP
jgi:hypothetical protein